MAVPVSHTVSSSAASSATARGAAARGAERTHARAVAGRGPGGAGRPADRDQHRPRVRQTQRVGAALGPRDDRAVGHRALHDRTVRRGRDHPAVGADGDRTRAEVGDEVAERREHERPPRALHADEPRVRGRRAHHRVEPGRPAVVDDVDLGQRQARRDAGCAREGHAAAAHRLDPRRSERRTARGAQIVHRLDRARRGLGRTQAQPLRARRDARDRGTDGRVQSQPGRRRPSHPLLRASRSR